MPIHVENNLCNGDSNPEAKKCKIHFMPCKIDGDGEANVAKYFDNYIKTDETGEMIASFRGHPLCGKDVRLPSEYSLMMLTEARVRPLTSKTDRFFNVAVQTQQFTNWSWDHTGNPQILAAMDSFDISEALCSSSETIEEETKSEK